MLQSCTGNLIVPIPGEFVCSEVLAGRLQLNTSICGEVHVLSHLQAATAPLDRNSLGVVARTARTMAAFFHLCAEVWALQLHYRCLWSQLLPGLLLYAACSVGLTGLCKIGLA